MRKQQDQAELERRRTEDLARKERLRTEEIAREEQLRQIRQKTNRRESRPLPNFSQAPFRAYDVPTVTTTTNATATTVTTNIVPPANPVWPWLNPVVPSAPRLSESQELAADTEDLATDSDSRPTALAGQFQQQVHLQPNLLDLVNEDVEMGDTDPYNELPENQYQDMDLLESEQPASAFQSADEDSLSDLDAIDFITTPTSPAPQRGKKHNANI